MSQATATAEKINEGLDTRVDENTTPTDQATTETAAGTKTKVQKVKFISKSPNQELKMIQSNRTVEHGVVIFRKGRSIQFENHEFQTSDPVEIEFVRNHRLFGTAIVEVRPEEENPFRRFPAAPMKRVTLTTQEKGARDGVVQIACGYVDPESGAACSYIAEAETREKAQRKLNGHRSKTGHQEQ